MPRLNYPTLTFLAGSLLGSLVLLLLVAGCKGEIGDPLPPPATSTQRCVVVSKPTWPAVAPDATIIGQLSDTSNVALERSPVPVLLPQESGWISNGLLMTGPEWYAFASVSDGVRLSLRGKRLAYCDTPSTIAPEEELRGLPALFVDVESGSSVTWHEFGVTYILTLTCDSPADGRCADRRLLSTTASSLVYAGGAAEMNQ